MLKVAVPLIQSQFSTHFGGTEKFLIFEVDEKKKEILSSKEEVPPPHETGTYPEFLNSLKVNVVIAGGMGPRAVSMLQSYGMDVVLGVQGSSDPQKIIQDFLGGSIQATGESCHDHSFHDCHK
ncbi:MAG: NifB/NifX family molybdenum-iron cluster-binding protein [Acidobacteriota bacterium]